MKKTIIFSVVAFLVVLFISCMITTKTSGSFERLISIQAEQPTATVAEARA